MKKDQFLKEFAIIVAEGDNPLTGAENLSDILGWDSVAILEFMAFADEKFGLSISGKELAACRSVNDLSGLLGINISIE